MTFSELKQKDVINVADGKRLGKVVDVSFTEGACIEAIIVPDAFNLLTCLSKNKSGIEIPWDRVRRIGDDVILVDVCVDAGK
ncbi:MAG: YlmC/YmxH family sporulation protein [Clostridia bacterium]|nr:YlmC/YmxH family sporulation protein [Clostridia bacterium]